VWLPLRRYFLADISTGSVMKRIVTGFHPAIIILLGISMESYVRTDLKAVREDVKIYAVRGFSIMTALEGGLVRDNFASVAP
jgi:uncharacterized membrane protein YeiH